MCMLAERESRRFKIHAGPVDEVVITYRSN
jgi:hypothetical protein